MRRALLLFGPVILAGLLLAFFAVRDRGKESAFALEQQRLARLDAATLEAALGLAREPREAGDGKPALSVECTPGKSGVELRNPWRCVARYPSGETIRYTVRIQPDGRFQGADRGNVRRVVGRIALPG
ncbi:MAG TPA: hypothetical protein VF529_17035 [Solirubrobacteraceae bacterium]|jgi:hypothetical protein